MTPSNKERALACASRGWLVFPSYQKKPLVRWGTQATLHEPTIRSWFEDEFPLADVCIKTGAESNLVVIDWDSYKQEDPGACPLADLPQTYWTRTSKGGWHFYFTHPGYPVANSASALADYVDVRGDGGMVVAYDPALDRALAPLPDGWGTRRTTITEATAPCADPYDGEGDGLTLAVSLLQGYADEILAAPEGTLNTTVWKRSSDAYKMVAAGELNEDSTYKLLLGCALAAFHPVESAVTTILSARRRGMLEPTSCVDMFWRSKGK